MCSIFCWRSKISFEIWLIPSHPQNMSGGIIFGHEALTNARNGKENSVISLEPSILGRVGTAIRGLMSSNLLGSFQMLSWSG